MQAANAEAGLLRLRDYAPEALVLDSKLAGMSGWDMLKHRAADPELPNVPVIILTTSHSTAHAGESTYTKTADTLIKPIGATDLIFAVSRLFG